LSNDSYEYLCEISDISDKIYLKIISKEINNNELKATIDIAHGLVRREKKEETLRRLVELGCHKYIPVMMDRSIVKIDKLNENESRIKTIIKECSEQSERGLLMNYVSPISFKELINISKEYDLLFVCFEESGRSNEKVLNKYLNDLENKKILVLIGPEGGISDEEIKLLKENNFILIGLGKRILRTETAPLFIMSLLGYHVEVGDKDE
ncbi:MAG: 16S rRNA (uracil(1498)-N(3))-methyltransferase, partial [Bacilli bacterium]|nr:16S rRNA (uracil(1498)-N(3))-methyltransferase [Bacilli bacterium]